MAEVRPPSLAEAEAYAELLWQSFGLDQAFCEALVQAHFPDLIRVVVDAGKLCGGLLIDPQAQAWGARRVPVVCIGGVAIDPVHRRRGWARRLLQDTLQQARSEGSVLAVLHASNHALYRSLGFEHAGQRWVIAVHPRDIAGDPRAATLERLDPADAGEVRDLYARWVLPHRDGALDRSVRRWDRALGEDRPGSAWCVGARGPNGQLEGYVSWAIDGHAPKLVARVGDFVASTPRAVSALCGTLAQLEATVSTVQVATAPDDPLWWSIHHPRATTVSSDAFLVRVLCPRKAVRQMVRAPEGAGAVQLQWDDPLFPAESGSVTLSAPSGRGSWAPSEAGGVRLGPRGLAALVSGRLRPHQAQGLGLLDGPAAQVARLDPYFPTRAVWLRDMF